VKGQGGAAPPIPGPVIEQLGLALTVTVLLQEALAQLSGPVVFSVNVNEPAAVALTLTD
jgi:hypothetical protein